MTQPGRELSWPDYQALREEARNWNVRLLQGAKIRSRCTSVTDMDSPSLYHVRKETTRGRLSMISSLSDGNGELIVDEGRINQILTDSFRQVFVRNLVETPPWRPPSLVESGKWFSHLNFHAQSN
ncbi:hypothetical protein DAPPUDRAFT_335151 [Daphnia pulex]|uniref:Uncharacterized protein n=1 Tax=Daphnia pulex TaxID=6669 RepID=E9HX47_DAPPU|nr:hypothetical protein DAPPUDRAFT_335151 [Daphnia pulex]|eukprot:EFX63683.1 hypothetical protein DAPPUDRAFT_335151 [Daphnia pulex]